MKSTNVVCIGAGPAGLTAGYLLAKSGKAVTVLESDPVYVGGISRTVKYKGFLFDIGGHRFFSKSKAINDFWQELLPNDFLMRPRSSKIYYGKKFYSYPLSAIEALKNLGILESTFCVLSYFWAKAFPHKNPRSFQDWITNQFGYRLFSIFFKTYTEKVWGMACTEISADWAAQRVKGLSLSSAIVSALMASFKVKRKKVIKTLIDKFLYPRQGPGMFWDSVAQKMKSHGGQLQMGCEVIRLDYRKGAAAPWMVTYREAGLEKSLECETLISSAPIRQLIAGMHPAPACVSAAQKLKYRDFITVALIVRDRKIFSDNWIYIHDPNVKVGRIQNFKSWSPEMVPDPDLNCYGLEYFCFEGDSLWESSDTVLLDLAKSEIIRLGLAKMEDIQDGCVVRQHKAYPVYDHEYQNHVLAIRKDLEENYPGLYLVGRNGMHKYNNQDHAMMTAILTVENILAGSKKFDVWRINEDAEYHETDEREGSERELGLRDVPRSIST